MNCENGSRPCGRTAAIDTARNAASPATISAKSKCTAWEDRTIDIRVRYFAAFREAAGIDTERVVTAANTPSGLFAECQQRHPSLQQYAASLVAVNDEMADWERVLEEGDEVLFFPPVAGG